MRALVLAALLPPRVLFAETSVSPDFVLSGSELDALTKTVPREIRARILAAPRQFLNQLALVLDEPADLFVLVDKSHALRPDYEPEDLVNIRAYSLNVSLGDVLLRRAIVPAARDLARAAKKDGITLVFSSGYRSFAYQRYVYSREVKMFGQQAADRESARPGSSQHQLGTAVDFGSITDDFARTPAGRWLAAHAWEHGFSLSYPEGFEDVTGYRYESWHYRFLTKPGMRLQRRYFGDVQQYMLEFMNEHRALLESRRLTAAQGRRRVRRGTAPPRRRSR
jgi:D-alanyl-D-alanine carboxypeptidase